MTPIGVTTWGFRLTERSKAQKKADKVYDQKRPAPVPVRLNPEELEALDKERGQIGRGAFLAKMWREKMKG